jgi:hypothetical protein
MKCARTREWMHLNRPGELDAESSLELERHLAACPECREAADRAARSARTADRAAALLRENPPVPSAGMTDRILAAVAGEKRPRAAVQARPGLLFPRGWFRTAALFPSRPARLSLAAVAVSAVLFFAGQEALVLSRVSRLEGRMAVLSSARPAPDEPWKELQSGLTAGGPASDEWVVVKKSDLDALAGRYPGDPELRSLIGRVERLSRPVNETGAASLDDVVRRLRLDPRTAEWIHQIEKRGGTPWNRI